jgi:hypothetical protein
MELSDAHRTLLRDLLHESLQAYQFPDKASFTRRHKRQFEELEQLGRGRLVRTEGKRLTLTLAGLLACAPDDLATEILSDFSKLWLVLERAYDTDSQNGWDALVLAGLQGELLGGTGQVAEVVYALHFMTDLAGWFKDVRTDGEGRISSLTLTDWVYKFNATNWVEKFRQQEATLVAAEGQEILTGPFAGMSLGRGQADAPDSLIFVSHAGDEELATALHKTLEAAALPTFKASAPENGLKGGKAWFEGIMAGLRASTGLVYVATPNSVTKHWPTFEVGVVFGRDCPSLTILCQGAGHGDAPEPLKNIQNVLASDSDETIKAKIAQVVGRTSQDLWSDPMAAKALGAFLELARKKPEVALNETKGPTPATSKDEKPVFLRDAASTIAEIETTWTAMSKEAPPSMALSKGVLGSTRYLITALHAFLKSRGITPGILHVVEGALRDTVSLEGMSPTGPAIGFSWEVYWSTGFDVIRRVRDVLAMEDVGKLKG